MAGDPDLSEKLRWPAAFPQLADIADTAFLDAVRQAQRLTIPTGAALVRKGSPCKDFLLHYKGCGHVQKSAESGREIILCRVGPGELSILALMSLIEGTAYLAEAIVEKEIQGLSRAFRSFKWRWMAPRAAVASY